MASLAFKGRGKASYIFYRISGKLIRRNIGRISNKTIGSQILRQFENDLALNKAGILCPKDISFLNIESEYLEWAKLNRAPNTYNLKVLCLKNFKMFIREVIKKPSVKNLMLCDLNISMIERYKGYRHNKGVSNRTINIELNTISTLINSAKKWDYRVPTVHFEPLKETKKLPRYLSQDEIQKLLNHSSNHLKQIIIIGLNTGMRIGEILNLEWQHIDLEKGILTISNSSQFQTKNKRDRIIPIRKELKSYLVHLEQVHFHARTDKVRPRNNNQRVYVICGEQGQRIQSVRNAFKRLLKRLNIPNACLHTLRHTFASNCVMNGVDLYTVKDFLGHRDMRTTEIYAHISNQHRLTAIEKLPSFSNVIHYEDLRLETG